MALAQTTNLVLSSLTIVAQFFLVGLVVLSCSRPGTPQHQVREFFTKRCLLFAFMVALAATLGSLFYSDIIGFEPCKLCWYQRIFMYPQVVLLGLALWKRDFGIAPYAISLSAIGALIAAYHYLLQLGVAPALPCSAVGYAVSCAQKFVLQFGYITIPMMVLTAFLLIIVLLNLARSHTK